jgi:CRISPR/Cas system CSM-associated protein Csm4 (group 5 of RAMP superfamily)
MVKIADEFYKKVSKAIGLIRDRGIGAIYWTRK